MKRKLLLFTVIAAMLICMLALVASAGDVHNANTVDYNATVTLDNGTTVNLFDSEGNALIWFMNGTELQSIRADDTDTSDGNYVAYVLPNAGYPFIANVNVHIGTTKVEIKNIVVFNIMDDDINAYYSVAGERHEGTEPFDVFIETFNKDNKNKNGTMALEYAYLRLDTTMLGQKAFARCTKLKYVNLEKLTQLRNLGSVNSEFNGVFNYGEVFVGCTALFNGQILDLSKTSLTRMATGTAKEGNFSSVPLIGVKFPVNDNKITLGSCTFQGCTSLKTVWIGGNIAEISIKAFDGAPLETVFFVGTQEELDAAIPKIATNYNQSFLGLAANNKISYEEYLGLSDKSGKHFVINYTSCAYNNGDHGELSSTGPCVNKCTVCGATVVNHNNDTNLFTAIVYSGYDKIGTKTTTCLNEGCSYCVTEETPALFKNLGYSAAEYAGGGMSIGFKVNSEAISEYEEIMGTTVNYGVFAVMKDKIGNNDIFGADGKAQAGVIAADITDSGFDLFNLKIVGFTEEQKEIDLAMGAYVCTTKDGATEYSYLQIAEPTSGKYYFASYNDVLDMLSSKEDEEVTQ